MALEIVRLQGTDSLTMGFLAERAGVSNTAALVTRFDVDLEQAL